MLLLHDEDQQQNNRSQVWQLAPAGSSVASSKVTGGQKNW